MKAARRNPRYWREIAVILVVKLAALLVIHETYFDQPVARTERIRHLSDNIYGDKSDGATAAEAKHNDR